MSKQVTSSGVCKNNTTHTRKTMKIHADFFVKILEMKTNVIHVRLPFSKPTVGKNHIGVLAACSYRIPPVILGIPTAPWEKSISVRVCELTRVIGSRTKKGKERRTERRNERSSGELIRRGRKRKRPGTLEKTVWELGGGSLADHLEGWKRFSLYW